MIWDIALGKQLRHDGSRFDLDVSSASDAPRLVLFGPSGAGKTGSRATAFFEASTVILAVTA